MEFTKVLLSEAKEGMELAEDILDEKGHLVLSSGTLLSAETIRKIEKYGVVVFKIVKRKSDAERETVSGENMGYYDKIKQTEGFRQFDTRFQDAVNDLSVEFNDIVLTNKEVHLEKMFKTITEVIEANKTSHSIFEVLDCIRGNDDETFVHSINVALICKVIGEWLGYNGNQTKQLITAGMLHDIGKVKIPLNILTKPGRLTAQEYQIVKCHTVFGYEILKEQPIDEHVKNTALMHHERYDGSGYPYGIKGREIDEIARIVAIADVYDAMTAKRVYRDKMSPFDVIEYFEKEISHYDPEILLLFLQRTAQSYVSNTVLLNTGERAKIAMINNSALGRPVVITDSGAIDLSREKDVKIVGLL